MRDERAADVVDGGGRALWATGVDEEAILCDLTLSWTMAKKCWRRNRWRGGGERSGSTIWAFGV